MPEPSDDSPATNAGRLVIYLDRFDGRKWTTSELGVKGVEDPEELRMLLARLREWGFAMKLPGGKLEPKSQG